MPLRPMKRSLVAGAVLGFYLVAGSAWAQQLEVSLRLGYQLPTGKIAPVPPDSTSAESFDMSESVVGEIPLGLELGARMVPMLAISAYAAIAPGIVPSDIQADCEALDHECSVYGFHVGVMSHLHLLPERAVDPWIGAGIGGEVLGFSESDGTHTVVGSFSGLEFPVRAGVGLALAENVSLGPYVEYTFGSFSSTSLRCSGPACTASEVEQDIDDTAPHGWFGFGAKVTILAL